MDLMLISFHFVETHFPVPMQVEFYDRDKSSEDSEAPTKDDDNDAEFSMKID